MFATSCSPRLDGTIRQCSFFSALCLLFLADVFFDASPCFTSLPESYVVKLPERIGLPQSNVFIISRTVRVASAVPTKRNGSARRLPHSARKQTKIRNRYLIRCHADARGLLCSISEKISDQKFKVRAMNQVYFWKVTRWKLHATGCTFSSRQSVSLRTCVRRFFMSRNSFTLSSRQVWNFSKT